jgi:hypothetical protein
VTSTLVLSVDLTLEVGGVLRGNNITLIQAAYINPPPSLTNHGTIWSYDNGANARYGNDRLINGEPLHGGVSL